MSAPVDGPNPNKFFSRGISTSPFQEARRVVSFDTVDENSVQVLKAQKSSPLLSSTYDRSWT